MKEVKNMLNQSNQITKKATVVTRQSRGGGEYVFPIKIYLALVDEKEGSLMIPKHFSEKRDSFVWLSENSRATKRVRTLEWWLGTLADEFNKGQKSWEQVQDEVMQ